MKLDGSPEEYNVMSRGRKYLIVDAMLDPNDRYGVKYKESLKGFLPCICCRRGLSDNSITCPGCNYDYNFCDRKCLKNRCIVLGFQCVFCHRQRNDDIIKILGGDTNYDLHDDLYGNKTIDALLQMKRK